jgi:general L-amino acid transport system permease protein
MSKNNVPWFRDDRFIKIGIQVLIVIILVTIIGILINNLIYNYQAKGFQFGFDFLEESANFDIGEALIEFQYSDSNYRALLIGLLNTLRIIIIGIILATIVGITIGIARLSNNWLVKQIAAIYIGIIRNTPLLLQLLFWYSAIFLKLPPVENNPNFYNLIFLSNRGLNIPWLEFNNNKTWLALSLIILGIVFIILIIKKRIKNMIQGKSGKNELYLLTSLFVVIIGSFFLGIKWNIPTFTTEKLMEGGLNLSPEFAALLIGLTVYTAAFIAEDVRAGILSVNKGQWEAAKALGLKPNLVMQLVIFPQALRVIIPPLTSEFLNLAKNSSLGVAIAYSDIYSVSFTMSENVNSHSIEIVLIIMITYLIINLIISFFMNRLNLLFQIKEK